jgi:hypothetical protein
MKLRPPDELSHEDIKAEPTDIQLFVRNGMIHLRTPDHDADALVPEDYMVLLGVSMAFGDPQFRHMMLAIVDQAHDDGALKGVITDVVTTSTIN